MIRNRLGTQPAMLALGAALLLALSPARAALFEDDDARKAILELRQKVEANRVQAQSASDKLLEESRRASEENVLLRKSLLDLQSQIEQLRGELANFRGQQEQFTRSLSDMQVRQKDIVQGVEERLRQFEPAKVSVDGADFSAQPQEKGDFEAALAVFRKGDFAPAQAAFTDFLRRFPASGYAPSALFWLGNAQYAVRDYAGAIASFRDLLTRAPEHSRAPEAVLSIANCQIELKDTRAARKTLEDLMKAYPKSEAAGAAKERLTRLR